MQSPPGRLANLFSYFHEHFVLPKEHVTQSKRHTLEVGTEEENEPGVGTGSVKGSIAKT